MCLIHVSIISPFTSLPDSFTFLLRVPLLASASPSPPSVSLQHIFSSSSLLGLVSDEAQLWSRPSSDTSTGA